VSRKVSVAACAAVALVLSCGSVVMSQESHAPLTEREVIELFKQYKGRLRDAAAVLERRGVDFDLDVKVEKSLRKAGADDDMIQEVWKASPTGRASQQEILTDATGARIQVSTKERMGLQTIESEPEPSRRVSMVDEFERQFPSSPILPHVLAHAAKACQEKGDLNKAIEYGEKSLMLDPNNLPSLVIVAISDTQPSMLRGSDTERNARLTEAQTDADHLLKLLDAVPKQPGETEGQFQSLKQPSEMDDQLQKRRNGFAADAHFALGMVALLREDPAKAVEQFNAAIMIAVNPPAQYYYRLGDAYAGVGKRDEALIAFEKAAEAGKGTAMEQLANKRVAELKPGKP
jgi:tetratricopeptide (TPR) repeat protein